jgi:hypothetical protein
VKLFAANHNIRKSLIVLNNDRLYAPLSKKYSLGQEIGMKILSNVGVDDTKD